MKKVNPSASYLIDNSGFNQADVDENFLNKNDCGLNNCNVKLIKLFLSILFDMKVEEENNAFANTSRLFEDTFDINIEKL